MPDTYGLDCPVARTLDIIGERWSVLILRDLFLHERANFKISRTRCRGSARTRFLRASSDWKKAASSSGAFMRSIRRALNTCLP